MIEWEGIRLDRQNNEVNYNNKPLFLDRNEYAILELFLHNQDRIFSHGNLIEYLWSYDEMPSEYQIKGYIESLQTKLTELGREKPIIEPVYGLGYRLKSLKKTPSRLFPTRQMPSSDNKSEQALESQKRQDTKLAAIFQHYRSQYLLKIQVLAQAVKALEQNTLSEELRSQAIQEAHTLSGSLGLFGFKIASEKCRQLEQLLKSHQSFDALLIGYFAKLISWLEQEISQQNSLPIVQSPSYLIPSSHTPYVLIIDDDEPLTKVLVSEARSWGMEAKAVHSLSEARVTIASGRPDLVILDLCFPQTDENGLDLLPELSNAEPPIPVLVSTIEESLDDRLKVAKLGGQAFLHKPISAEQIMEAIAQLLRQSNLSLTKLMIVDDEPQILEFLHHLLEPWGFSLTLVHNCLQFWDILEQTNPDLLILDLEMPNFSGIDLCQIVRNDPKWLELPILMLSENTNADIIAQVFAVGADDYVDKPIIGPELIARIHNRLERTQMRRRLAEVDSLTGLSNRRKFVEDLTRLLKLAQRQKQPLCYVLIDLDHFKQVNDKYGHDMGDRVLRQLGKLLKRQFRCEDLIGRWGGEEFALGLYGMNKSQAISRLKDILEQWRQEEFRVTDNHCFCVTFSAGIAMYPTDGAELQNLYRFADVALYRAKKQGRNQVIG